MQQSTFDKSTPGNSRLVLHQDLDQVPPQLAARLLRSHVKPLLVATKINVEKGMIFQASDTAETSLDAALRSIDKCIATAKELFTTAPSTDLRQDSLAGVLRQQIQWLQGHFEQFLIKTELEDVTISDGQTAAILCETVRELVLNAVEHSGADAVAVKLKKLDGHSPLVHIVEVIVRDEGTGFDLDAVNRDANDKAPGGLTAIRQLLESRGGSFAVESRPGSGTTATIRVVEVANKQQ